MTDSNTIRIEVDPTNPGQFFACCGLLELADRLWPGAEGWFEEGDFCVTAKGTLLDLLSAFGECKISNTMSEVQNRRLEELASMSGVERKKTKGLDDEKKSLEKLRREEPILLQGRIRLLLDWFTDDQSGGSRFKTWAGQQSVLSIASSMNLALQNELWKTSHCLSYSVSDSGLPFNFDSDLGGQGGAVDVGFSFDPLAASALTRIESTAKPVLELLAFIGLQRFRATEVQGENRFHYSTWKQPLPIAVSVPVANGCISIVGATTYEFRLLYRTKYLKSFLPAVPYSGDPEQ